MGYFDAKRRERELGEMAERIWRAAFHSAGFNWLWLSKIADGGAPMSSGLNGASLISPDGLTTNGEFTVYAEVKGKSHPVAFWLADGELRHGIKKKNWEHYVGWEAKHRQHLCICVFEEFRDMANSDWSGALLMNTVAKLAPAGVAGHQSLGDTILFPRTAFRVIGNITREQALAGTVPPFTEQINSVLEIGTKPPIQRHMF